jgi:hypothetical protein
LKGSNSMPINLFKNNEEFLSILSLIDSGEVEFANKDQIYELANSLDVDPYHFFLGNKTFPIFYYNKHVLYKLLPLACYQTDSIGHVKHDIHLKTELISEALNNNDFEKAFLFIDKSIRFDSYVELFDLIPEEKKYDIFLDLYTSAEYGFGDFRIDAIKQIFEYRKFSKKKKSIRKRLKRVANQEGYIEIFRGVGKLSTPAREGLSWTINLEKAYFFAYRFQDPHGKVYKAKVHVSKVLEFITERNESEILVLPENIINIEELKEKK